MDFSISGVIDLILQSHNLFNISFCLESGDEQNGVTYVYHLVKILSQENLIDNNSS